MLRRGSSLTPLVLEWGSLQLDPSSLLVTYAGAEVSLTAKEYKLLELFLRHPHQVLSRSAILDHLWAFEDPPEEDAVKTLIKRLRQKMTGVGAPELIETIYGIGYRLKPHT